jgi:hypothetical protein
MARAIDHVSILLMSAEISRSNCSVKDLSKPLKHRFMIRDAGDMAIDASVRGERPIRSPNRVSHPAISTFQAGGAPMQF